MDGANVEIAELVGDENIYIFGEDSDCYRPLREICIQIKRILRTWSIKPLVDFIVSDAVLAVGKKERFERLYNGVISKDWFGPFMTLLDLETTSRLKSKCLLTTKTVTHG